jgi:hypothetical protein
MELKKQTFLYYQTVLDAVSAPEASAEMIVPDLFPDMAHIADAAGQACVKETALRDDRLDLTGIARVGILYMPEDGSGLRKLEVTIPFNHVFDGRFPAGSEVHCEARLLDAEARTVNPRKVSVLARLSIHAVVYAPAELSVPAETDEECEIKRQVCSAYMPVAVKSRSFTINEGVEISASRPPIEDIVTASTRVEVTDVKTVGSKAVFKGAATVGILYLSGGVPVKSEHEISLSQIMDIDGLDDDSFVDLDLKVTGAELDFGGLSGSDGRNVSVALHIEAQAVAYAERKIEAITDLYSTTGRLRPVMEPLNLTELTERSVRRQAVREILEVDADIRSIIDSRVILGPMIRLESGEVGCEAYAGLLCVGEGGELHSVNQKLAVAAGIGDEGASVTVRLAGEITAAPSSGGIELRFAVDFTSVLTKPARLMTVGSVHEEDETERPRQPSVVLRRCQPGEGLWEIAKRYHTTVGDLCLANGLDDCEETPNGKLLLIPKKRS